MSRGLKRNPLFAVVENADIGSDVVFIANGGSTPLILKERTEIINTIASGWAKNLSAQIHEIVLFGNVGVQWLTRLSRHACVEPRVAVFPFLFDVIGLVYRDGVMDGRRTGRFLFRRRA